MNNKSRNRKMIIILTLFVALLLSTAIYMVYFQLMESSFYSNHVNNARNRINENEILRGTIYDRDGNALAYSTKDNEGQYIRINNYNYIYSSIIGYHSNRLGSTGIEGKFNNELLNRSSDKDIISKLEDIYDNNQTGNDIYLTIDSNIQSKMYELLEDNTGAIVVLDVETGKILSMVSKPTFNVNEVEINWDRYNSSENGVLTNRATQGLYTPGSTFKVITSVAMLENNINTSYDDVGETIIDGYPIQNYRNRSYGQVDLREALVHSINTYFSDKSKELTNLQFLNVTKRFMLGQEYDTDYARSLSRVPFDKNIDELEKAVTAFGQGNTLVTPLDMATVAQAIANEGVMMKPQLVDKVGKNDNLIERKIGVLSQGTSSDIANTIAEYMKDTALNAGYQLDDGGHLAGKSGTAETNDLEHSWYIGFGPYENPKYAVAVVLEHFGIQSDQSAGKIFNRAMNYLDKLQQ